MRRCQSYTTNAQGAFVVAFFEEEDIFGSDIPVTAVLLVQKAEGVTETTHLLEHPAHHGFFQRAYFFSLPKLFEISMLGPWKQKRNILLVVILVRGDWLDEVRMVDLLDDAQRVFLLVKVVAHLGPDGLQGDA
jgi:hypothetical protein